MSDGAAAAAGSEAASGSERAIRRATGNDGEAYEEVRYEAVIAALQEAAPQVIARAEQEEIWLDLRSVFPRWDQHLIAALG